MKHENSILIQQTTSEDLINAIASRVSELLEIHRTKELDSKTHWTAEEVATYCKVTKGTVYNWVKQGRLTKHRIGSRVLYKVIDVKDAIRVIEKR